VMQNVWLSWLILKNRWVEIVSGLVQAVGTTGLTIGLEMKTEASMPRKEMIPGERFHIHDRVRALVAEVKDNQRGPQVILRAPIAISCAACWKMKSLRSFMALWKFVPSPANLVNAPKVAVSASQPGIDPGGGLRWVTWRAHSNHCT